MWLGKDEQVAAVLRELIGNGEWQGKLPGYRKLEQRLKVSRETIEKALARLESEGLVTPAVPGRRRELIGQKPAVKTSLQRRLLVVGPRPIHDCSPTQRDLLTAIFQQAESRGWKVTFHHFDFGFPRRAVNAIRQAVIDHSPLRVLLVTPSAALEKWAEDAEVPCYKLGGATMLLSGAGVSFSAIVCSAAGLLWKQGHRRLLIPIVSGKEEMRERTMQVCAESWARDIPRIELAAMFPEQGEWLPDVLKGFWPKQFARLKPTAVIVKESNEFLSLLSYCYRHGIRIPEDLSVVQLSGDPACAWLDPSPDRFEFPVGALCGKVMHWLEKPAVKNAPFEWLEATYHPGGTVAEIRPGR